MNGVELRLNKWFASFRAAWDWWLSELIQLVPLSVCEALSDTAVVITARGGELSVARRTAFREATIARIPRDEFAARTLRLSVPRETGWRRWLADPVILELPASEVLHRHLSLPYAARRNLGDILRHEVVRQSPIDAQQIYYDYHATSADVPGGSLDIDLRIIRREPVDDLLALCADAGVSLSAIAFDSDADRADGGTFPIVLTREQRIRTRIVPGLLVFTLVLIAGFVLSAYLRGQAVGSDLEQRVDEARARAMVVQRLESQLDAANRQAAFLTQQKRNPAAVAVLATVAKLLPDDAWLYQFEMNGDEVRLHGFSASAASLIALFDSCPDFRDAQFRAPLMQGPDNNLQRFDLSFHLKKPAA